MGWDPNDRASFTKGAKVAFSLLGMLFFAIWIQTIISEARLFLDPKYKGIWEEAKRYQLRPESRPSRQVLLERYDPTALENYFENPIMRAAYLPSEEASFVNVLIYTIRYRDKPDFMGLSWGLILLVIYLPATMFLRNSQRLITSWLCITAEARQARTEYFAALDRGSWRGRLTALAVTVGLAFVNANRNMSAEMSEAGLTLIALTGGFAFLAYFSGLLMRVVGIVIDAVCVISGKNPHHIILDDIIAIAIVAPVLHFMYANSWLSILSSAIAGLGTSLYLKWRQRHQRGKHATNNPENV